MPPLPRESLRVVTKFSPIAHNKYLIIFELKKMSRNYKFYNPEGLYFVSFAVVGWLDVFTRNEYKDLVLESLEYFLEVRINNQSFY